LFHLFFAIAVIARWLPLQQNEINYITYHDFTKVQNEDEDFEEDIAPWHMESRDPDADLGCGYQRYHT
jgi:hypothetical protein